ncbi:hypothetical protein HanXRQr2_Chr08g0344271 [Helianthus annuus]|uniref:Uncharacterized protein n=1 Tax=Helianthus annuus TaxID=4232 RepID=A0A9K3IFL5_HELAN|nr:hypothetical protein HanXRQr2_Chr08g0344271 [Helianthus annuus]
MQTTPERAWMRRRRTHTRLLRQILQRIRNVLLPYNLISRINRHRSVRRSRSA